MEVYAYICPFICACVCVDMFMGMTVVKRDFIVSGNLVQYTKYIHYWRNTY